MLGTDETVSVEIVLGGAGELIPLGVSAPLHATLRVELEYIMPYSSCARSLSTIWSVWRLSCPIKQIVDSLIVL